MGGIYTSVPVAKNHVQASGTTHHWEIPVSASPYLSIQVVWHDAVSAFSSVLRSTNRPTEEVPGATGTTGATNAEEWTAESGVSVPTVAAAAAGSLMVHLTSINSRRISLSITTTANSRYSIYSHGKS